MTMFQIKELPKLLDATDALSVAVCHYFQKGEAKSKGKSWEAFLTDNPNRLKKKPI
jgi:crossover junction endodeoxyribonuclease RuvC